MLQKILDIANSVPPGTYEALIASGVISPLLLAIKKAFKVKSERFMVTLLMVVSMLAAAGNYLLHVPSSNPSIIALQGSVIAFMTQPVYFFLVKPVFTRISETLTAAAAFDREVKSALEPASGLPISNVPPAPPAFSNTTTPNEVDFSN